MEKACKLVVLGVVVGVALLIIILVAISLEKLNSDEGEFIEASVLTLQSVEAL